VFLELLPSCYLPVLASSGTAASARVVPAQSPRCPHPDVGRIL